MADPNYGWFGTKSTSDVDDVKRRLALQLLLQGTDTSPVQHWTQGAARMANALVGNYALGKMEDQNKELYGGIAKALMPQSNESSVQPTTAPPVQTGSDFYPADTGSGPSSTDMAMKDVADSLRVSPEALRSVVQVESNFNPRATSPSGTYAGATQIGPDTFKEAGGRLGGMTSDQYRGASLPQQLLAYPDYLKHYGTLDKLRAAGIDVGSLPNDQQFGILQAAQFAPNGAGWLPALAAGNPNVPSTNTPQSPSLGDKSVAGMAASPYGRVAAALGGGVGQAAASPSPVAPPSAPQPAPLSQAPPPPPQIAQAPQPIQRPNIEMATPERAQPEIPPNIARAADMLIRAGKVDQGMALIQQYAKPTAYSFSQLPDGTIVRQNPATGQVSPVYRIPEKPSITTIKDKNGNEVSARVDPYSGRAVPIQLEGEQPTAPGAMPNGQPIPQPPPGVDNKTWRQHVSANLADAASGKLTEEQAKSTQFANRMEQAEKLAKQFQGQAQNLKDTVVSHYGGNNPLASTLISDGYQQFQQAKSQFITALLRRESGAAINKDEFIRYEKEFFPRYGETDPAVIKQKEEARRVAIEAMIKTAGPSYKSIGGGAGQSGLPKVSSPAEAGKLPRGTRFLDPNGVERVVP